MEHRAASTSPLPYQCSHHGFAGLGLTPLAYRCEARLKGETAPPTTNTEYRCTIVAVNEPMTRPVSTDYLNWCCVALDRKSTLRPSSNRVSSGDLPSVSVPCQRCSFDGRSGLIPATRARRLLACVVTTDSADRCPRDPPSRYPLSRHYRRAKTNDLDIGSLMRAVRRGMVSRAITIC